MKSIYSKIIAVLLVICTFTFFDGKYHILDKFDKDDIISQEEMIQQIGGVSETYVGKISEVSYSSAESAATAYIEKEVAGESVASVSETKSVATLSKDEAKEIIPEELLQGVDSIEKYEVTYSVSNPPSLDPGGDIAPYAEELSQSKTVTVYVIKCGTDWKYFTPKPVTGETISKSYYDSVFNNEKYKNCTFKVEQITNADVSMTGLSEPYSGTMSVILNQTIMYADGKIYLNQKCTYNNTGSFEDSSDVAGALMSCEMYIEEGQNGEISYYMKSVLFDDKWINCETEEIGLEEIGYGGLEELTPFYDQYLDYTYFTKTDYGFKLDELSITEYFNYVFEEFSFLSSVNASDDMSLFAEYFVSQGVLSGMRMSMNMDYVYSASGLTMTVKGDAKAVATCTNYGTTVVEKPF